MDASPELAGGSGAAGAFVSRLRCLTHDELAAVVRRVGATPATAADDLDLCRATVAVSVELRRLHRSRAAAIASLQACQAVLDAPGATEVSPRSRRPHGARRWRRRPIVGGGRSPVRARGPRPRLGGPRRDTHAAVPTDRCLTPGTNRCPRWSRCPVLGISRRSGCRCSGRRPASALRTSGPRRRPCWRPSPAPSPSSRPNPSSHPACGASWSTTASSTWTPVPSRSIRLSTDGAAGGSDLRGGPSGSRSRPAPSGGPAGRRGWAGRWGLPLR
jgi:hypothetical protein